MISNELIEVLYEVVMKSVWYGQKGDTAYRVATQFGPVIILSIALKYSQ